MNSKTRHDLEDHGIAYGATAMGFNQTRKHMEITVHVGLLTRKVFASHTASDHRAVLNMKRDIKHAIETLQGERHA